MAAPSADAELARNMQPETLPEEVPRKMAPPLLVALFLEKYVFVMSPPVFCSRRGHGSDSAATRALSSARARKRRKS